MIGWLLIAAAAVPAPAGPKFEVTIPAGAVTGPVTGRVFVAVTPSNAAEPRLLISPRGAAIFAVDIEGRRAGEPIVLGDQADGYPVDLKDFPAGEYYVQALIHRYEQVHLADGRVLWLPMNDGTIEPFNVKSGNLVSEPVKVRIEPGVTIKLSAGRILTADPEPKDTEWIKHVRIQSAKLTAFWGRPIYLHATVLLPRGYDDHPAVRYPTVFAFGFGRSGPFFFTPDSTAVRRPGVINPATGLDTGFDFYRAWTGDGFPRMIAVTFEQSTPYFPDSYSVNSANNGPYGDAMVEEVIPELERRFRMIPAGYARHLEGASTNGWQSLALVLNHPDFFGGAWILQPDPIDFRRYGMVNIYEDANAFTMPTGPFTTLERPFQRNVEGQVVITMRQLSRFEATLGSKGRSGFQLEAWEAVYGPPGPDGYPKALWDKRTGVIDRGVATAMRDGGYDLLERTRRDWETLGPKICGKLHFTAGDMDDFYLNLAVYRYQEFLAASEKPHCEGDFRYGRPTKGHAWHAETFHALVVKMAEQIRAAAPAGAPTDWWH